MSCDQQNRTTRFYLVEKRGTGFSIVKSIIVDGWKHYDVSQSEDMKNAPEKRIPLKKFKKLSLLSNEFLQRTIFAWDLEAPGDVLIVEWVGMRKLPTLSRTFCGIYYSQYQWPDELSKEEWKKCCVEF